MVRKSSISKSPSEQSSKPASKTHAPRIQSTNVSSNQVWRLATVLNNTGLGKTKAYELIKDGRFPAPRKIGRMSIWSSLEVQAWIDSRLGGGAA